MIRFEELGQAVATVQDADRKALPSAEEASASYIRQLRQRGQGSRKLVWLAAAAVVTLTIGVSALWLRSSVSPSQHLAAMPGVPTGQPIVAPDDRGIPLNFSDGSRVELAAGAKANVIELTHNGATIELQTGKASAVVIHREDTHWSMHAGPYRVAVTGTQFALEWLPNRHHFDLTLSQGSVIVSTENSSHAAVTMRSPEHLVIDDGEWHLSSQLEETTLTGSPSANALLLDPAKVVENRPAPVQSAVGARPIQPSEPAATVPDWQRLAQQGKYADAYAHAQQLGIANLAQSASAQPLLVLAEICRFTGHASESLSTLAKLRQRFAGSNEAAIAAFQLGRLSSDGHLAATWFRSYLHESPNGDLAREASGRVLEALDRAGDHAAAAKAAEQYLQRYPSGPHAKFARRLTSQ